MPDTGVADPAPATAASGRSPATAVPSRAERDRALFTRFRDPDDPVDRDVIVDRFLPLARRLAARCERPKDPFDDIFQVACFGLVKAVGRFDPARGIAFSSFAVPTMTGEIKRHFRDRAWSVRVPRDLQRLTLRVDRVVADLTRDRHQPSVADSPASSASSPRAHALAHAATARGDPAAFRAGPHSGRDRRAHRRQPDAGVTHPAPAHRPAPRARRGPSLNQGSSRADGRRGRGRTREPARGRGAAGGRAQRPPGTARRPPSIATRSAPLRASPARPAGRRRPVSYTHLRAHET